ncbi:MAG: peptidase C15 [Beijerinckiaceae bacterium]
MSAMKRILITGFGPFLGAPSNPTMAIVRHLLRSRYARIEGLELVGRVLPTQWSMLPDFAETIRQQKPDAVLMFGLAGRRRSITPEARAVNHATTLRLDAAGQAPAQQQLAKHGPGFRRSSIDPVSMVAAMRRSSLPAKMSQDAGDYLCNALLWTALDTDVPAIFVHVPRPRRATLPKGRLKRPRPSMGTVKQAAEVALRVAIDAA